jgi:hypothetical protein
VIHKQIANALHHCRGGSLLMVRKCILIAMEDLIVEQNKVVHGL